MMPVAAKSDLRLVEMCPSAQGAGLVDKPGTVGSDCIAPGRSRAGGGLCACAEAARRRERSDVAAASAVVDCTIDPWAPGLWCHACKPQAHAREVFMSAVFAGGDDIRAPR
jgi:hypothetical protein